MKKLAAAALISLLVMPAHAGGYEEPVMPVAIVEEGTGSSANAGNLIAFLVIALVTVGVVAQ